MPHPAASIALLCLAFAAGTAPAQIDVALLKERLDRKLAKKFVQNAPWRQQFDAALADARRDDKLVFGYFTRSYAAWGPCEIVEDGLLSSSEFHEFATREVVPFLHVTTNLPDRAHDDLLRTLGGDGFPTLMFLDADGKVLHVQGAFEDHRTVAALRDSLRALDVIAGAAVAPERVSAAERLWAELVLYRVDAKTARERRAALIDLAGELAIDLDRRIEAVEIDRILEQGDADGMSKAVEQLHAMVLAGRAPTSVTFRTFRFWAIVLQQALVDQDRAWVDRAWAALQPLGAAESRFADYMKQIAPKVETLRAKSSKDTAKNERP